MLSQSVLLLPFTKICNCNSDGIENIVEIFIECILKQRKYVNKYVMIPVLSERKFPKNRGIFLQGNSSIKVEFHLFIKGLQNLFCLCKGVWIFFHG